MLSSRYRAGSFWGGGACAGRREHPHVGRRAEGHGGMAREQPAGRRYTKRRSCRLASPNPCGTRLQDAGADEGGQARRGGRLSAQRVARNLGQHHDVLLLHRHQLGQRLRKRQHHLRLAGRHGALRQGWRGEGGGVWAAGGGGRRRCTRGAWAAARRLKGAAAQIRYPPGGAGGWEQSELDCRPHAAPRRSLGRASPAPGGARW